MNGLKHNGTIRRIIPLHHDEITGKLITERFETDIETIQIENVISPDLDPLEQLINKEENEGRMSPNFDVYAALLRAARGGYGLRRRAIN